MTIETLSQWEGVHQLNPQCGVRIGGGEWKRDGKHTEARAQQENLGTGDRHDDNWEDIRVLDWENRKKTISGEETELSQCCEWLLRFPRQCESRGAAHLVGCGIGGCDSGHSILSDYFT